jgi:hypothetical protein
METKHAEKIDWNDGNSSSDDVLERSKTYQPLREILAMNAYIRIGAGLIIGFQIMGLVACGPMDEQENAEATAAAPELETARQTLLHGQRVHIRPAHSAKCFDIEGASPYNNARAVQWNCWGGSNQRFYAEAQPDGWSWKFWAAHSGKCLTVQSYNYGAAIWQVTCDGSNPRHNFLVEYNWWSGTYTLKPRDSSSRCVEVPGSSFNNGTPISLWGCHGGLNQQFYIEAI